MINWAKKVSKELIRRLYLSDSRGENDMELADEIGWALFARCESIISVTYGFELKKLICAYCGAEVPLEEDRFVCMCGKLDSSWEEFRRSYKNKQLYGANALPVFLKYRSDFPKAVSYGEKMIAIDTLIHSFHVLHSYRLDLVNIDPYDDETKLGRPTAVNLIEGSLSEVIDFLDRLSADKNETVTIWQKTVKRANGYNLRDREK